MARKKTVPRKHDFLLFGHGSGHCKVCHCTVDVENPTEHDDFCPGTMPKASYDCCLLSFGGKRHGDVYALIRNKPWSDRKKARVHEYYNLYVLALHENTEASLLLAEEYYGKLKSLDIVIPEADY